MGQGAKRRKWRVKVLQLGPLLMVCVLFGCAQESVVETIRERPIQDVTFEIEKEYSQEEVKNPSEEEGDSAFVMPLSEATSRITKKPFGILIDPATSPVQPERFAGYHTGTDFEVFPEELERPVDVFSVCDGVIEKIETVGGYGGVIVQSCVIMGEKMSILYGHVSLDDATITVGQTVTAGTKITELGDHKSVETDGERKHLHLGVSFEPNVRGYVQLEKDLSAWSDVVKYIIQ